MGILNERIKLSLLVNGNGLEDNYKRNSLYLMDKVTKTDDEFEAVDKSGVYPGNFYFFQYDIKNTSVKSWEKWSPVFVVESKKTGNPLFPLVYYAVNFNFIPLQIRTEIFDPYFTEEIFEKNIPLKVNRMGMEKELLKWGFEYSIRSYNAIQLNLVHKIDMNSVPRFLMSGHPRATYDPKKLMEIWNEKIKTRDQRHNEMMQSLLTDFYDINGQIKDRYKVLKGNIQNIQNSLKNFKR